ncbi:MAG: OadG family protein [Ruminococcus sp.]|nr:OadG family protein [Ruminococcus sp.]
MSNFSLATFFPLAELTMAQRGVEALKVILTGFAVVFAVLFFLIVIIKIYSKIVVKLQDVAYNKKKKKIKDDEVLIKKPSKPVSSTEPVTQDGIPEEVVAVISAAVASMYDSPKRARIKSIKRSASGRSAWANAGVADNTRPF